jgi:hypothetical protein
MKPLDIDKLCFWEIYGRQINASGINVIPILMDEMLDTHKKYGSAIADWIQESIELRDKCLFVLGNYVVQITSDNNILILKPKQ